MNNGDRFRLEYGYFVSFAWTLLAVMMLKNIANYYDRLQTVKTHLS